MKYSYYILIIFSMYFWVNRIRYLLFNILLKYNYYFIVFSMYFWTNRIRCLFFNILLKYELLH